MLRDKKENLIRKIMNKKTGQLIQKDRQTMIKEA